MSPDQIEQDMILEKIMHLAQKTKEIKGVILNGSRASPSGLKDEFQDYDIIFVVEDVKPFVKDQEWITTLGQILIKQLPDQMDGHWPKNSDKFTFLMLFDAGHRIDLTFMQKKIYVNQPKDSQSICLLDKNQDLGSFAQASDKDYLPLPPTEKEFLDCCNEFLWCSQNIIKGICRQQILYSKIMFEQVVRPQLIKLLAWYAGIQTDFQQNFGSYYKYLEKYLDSKIWNKFVTTYSDTQNQSLWQSVGDSYELFKTVSTLIAQHFKFKYPEQDYNNMLEYFEKIKVKYKKT